MKLLILSLLVALAVAEKVRYDGYQTLRIEPKGEIQNDYIHHLAETLDEKYDFWAHIPNKYTDVMTAPNLMGGFKYLLESRDIDYHIMVEDVQTLIDNQDGVTQCKDFHACYHTYDEIQDWVHDMANQHSDIAEQFKIATSYNGLDINALKISSGEGKRVVYFQGGIHAREWISPATVMYMTEQLLENNGDDYLKDFDFYIVPSLNVDGYVHTWSNDRMWRKTRNENPGKVCMGVDPNRNYGYKWKGGSGSSNLACSDVYRGPSAFSEQEVNQTTTFLMDLKRNEAKEVACFIDFHSYSQLWLSPYSYTEKNASNSDAQVGAAKYACEALKAVSGTEYTYGPSADTLYAADGCSLDWGYEVLKAPYSYVVELRDTGKHGFVLPENQIIPTGVETYEGLKALLNYIKNNN